MSLVVLPEFARAMALELVRRYDFDPNFVFTTVLLFVVFTFGFVVGNAYGGYSRVRSLQDVLSFFPVREGQYSVLVTRMGECFHTSEHCRGLRHAQQQVPKKTCKVCFAGLQLPAGATPTLAEPRGGVENQCGRSAEPTTPDVVLRSVSRSVSPSDRQGNVRLRSRSPTMHSPGDDMARAVRGEAAPSRPAPPVLLGSPDQESSSEDAITKAVRGGDAAPSRPEAPASPDFGHLEVDRHSPPIVQISEEEHEVPGRGETSPSKDEPGDESAKPLPSSLQRLLQGYPQMGDDYAPYTAVLGSPNSYGATLLLYARSCPASLRHMLPCSEEASSMSVKFSNLLGTGQIGQHLQERMELKSSKLECPNATA